MDEFLRSENSFLLMRDSADPAQILKEDARRGRRTHPSSARRSSRRGTAPGHRHDLDGNRLGSNVSWVPAVLGEDLINFLCIGLTW